MDIQLVELLLILYAGIICSCATTPPQFIGGMFCAIYLWLKIVYPI